MVAALMVVMTLQYTQMKSYNAMHLKFIFIHQFYLNKEKLNLSNIKKRERENHLSYYLCKEFLLALPRFGYTTHCVSLVLRLASAMLCSNSSFVSLLEETLHFRTVRLCCIYLYNPSHGA